MNEEELITELLWDLGVEVDSDTGWLFELAQLLISKGWRK